MNNLKSLAEHNQERERLANALKNSQPMKIARPTGLACPNCQKELFDKPLKPFTFNISEKVSVYCPECKFEGERY